jgi:arylsulfatase A-like enzyme
MTCVTRRVWMSLAVFFIVSPCQGAHDKPNIILVMADDLGWGDVAYNGNPVALTPNLDDMARQGIRFNRFYAAAPVCSPTRGSCLTGRHPYRYKLPWAGEDPLPAQEITLAEALKKVGYATGHFGKWHLGQMSKTIKQSYFAGPVDPRKYSPPWENGFDECFSTASMMPTYNPYYHVGGDYGTDDYRHVQDCPVEKGQKTHGFRWRDHYWTGPGQLVDDWLEGDDSQIIMDRAIKFIQRRTQDKQAFLSLIWFHAVHTPVVAGHSDRSKFPDQSMAAQHWFGCIHAMDRQMGRLRKELKRLDIAKNTILWFCSDNGPSYIHNLNSAGPLRGKKGSLWEGGIRVPALLEWPGRFDAPRSVNSPVFTSDFYPTLVNLAQAHPKRQPVVDGIDVMPLIEGKLAQRPAPIAFQSPVRGKQWDALEGQESMVILDDKYKLISMDSGKTFQLYDLQEDIGETQDIIAKHPDIAQKLKSVLQGWQQSCKNSSQGKDYQSENGDDAKI